MSLFPAAEYDPTSSDSAVKKEQVEPQSWLQNKSYHAVKASKLIEYEQKLEYDSSSSETDVPIKKHKKATAEKRTNIETATVKKEPANDLTLSKVAYIVDQFETVGLKKFKADKFGDKDNLHFSRPYKVLIPKFYRDCVFCLGTPNWKHVEMSITRKKKKQKRRPKDKRYFTSKIPTARSYAPSKFSPLYEHFLALRDENSDVSEKQQDEDFSNIETVKKVTEKFNRETRANPNDVNLWKKFVSWQDQVMSQGAEHVKSRVVTEKKVEILNHAVRANPKDASLQILRVRLQSELESDQSIVDKEWENILFRFPDNLEVWKSYLLHINCDSFSSFSVKRTKRAYAHCIEIMRSIKEGTYVQETSSGVSGEQRLVKLLSEYAHFLAATGHTEQWVAVYQCMLELNFRAPSTDTDWSDMIEYLKVYYEGDDKGIGEDGSKGFADFANKHVSGGWISSNVSNSADDDQTEEEDDIDPEKSLTENWLEIDRSRSEKHWLPWRPSYEGEECDDDERKVSFADIKDFLFIVENETTKMQILEDFLSLLGSPVSTPTSSTNPFASQSIFHFSHLYQPLRPYEQLYIARPFLIGKEQSARLGCLNQAKHLYICKVFQQLFHAAKSKDSLHSLLCNCYALYFEKRSISFYTDDQSQALKVCGKEAKKEMKKMLSVKPNLLEAWCSFTVTEWLSGKRHDAMKVFQTSVSMSVTSLHHGDRIKRRETEHKIFFMCRTMSQLHLTTCNNCDVTDSEKTNDCPHKKTLSSILLCLADGCKFERIVDENIFKSTSIVKAVTGFHMLLEELQSLYEQFDYEKDFSRISENEFSSPYFNVVCCFFVFSIYFIPEDMHKIASESITYLNSKIKKGCFQAKIDLENMYELYFWYMKESKKFLPNNFRKLVYGAADTFPCNPHFAWILGEFDISSYLSGNARRHFGKACSEYKTSVIPWLCAIKYELKRRKRILETPHDIGMKTNSNNTLLDVRIKNLFEHALSIENNPGSAVLWRAYIYTQSRMDPSKVEGLYTRALDSCSWSLNLHLDILTYQPDKLTEVVANISRKNLRLRTPVEEVQLLMSF